MDRYNIKSDFSRSACKSWLHITPDDSGEWVKYSDISTIKSDTIQKIIDDAYKKYGGVDVAIPLSELQKMADDMKGKDNG